MIGNAQRDGAIHPDVTFGDVSLLLIRLARPLPPGQDRAVPALHHGSRRHRGTHGHHRAEAPGAKTTTTM